jgi:eukaryotic-like serine/threonine-protein kinase
MDPAWRVADYIVEDPAGFARGTFGTLYAARRSADNLKVALKLILLTNAADARERLEAERHGAMLQQRFEQAHGMVPHVYEYGPYNEHLYIAMEFVEGKSLSELTKAGLTPRDAAAHAAGICEFLDRAHRFETTIEDVHYDRVVHADLKPDHVLIAESGAMKILDFGIAKALEKTTEVTTNNWSTVAYASPERLQSGGHVNVYADFWSLGVMLYEMVSGHLPYPSLTPRHLRSQLETAIRTNARPEPLPVSCPPELAAIVRKLMAPQVEHRYSTASAIRQDLETFLRGEIPSATAQYETPATVPILRSAIDRAVLPPVVVPPTDPFPVAAPGGVAVAEPAAKQAVGAAVRAPARRGVRRMAWFAMQVAVVLLIAAEGGAWVAAERFRRDIPAVDGRTLADRHRQYAGIRSRSMFDTGLRLRVNQPLRRQLVGLADMVIADYRSDGPTMSAAEWRQANDAMKWVLELAPWDDAMRARQALCEAHLARFAARRYRRGTEASRQAYDAAIALFRSAARLDTRSYDPYLGISNIQAYGLDDVDLAAEAIEQAEKRGYQPGRRERAQLGDGYLKRADRARRRAAGLSGEQRRSELERAREDYERCAERFDPIRDFGNAAGNLDHCRANSDRISSELEERSGLQFRFTWPWSM